MPTDNTQVTVDTDALVKFMRNLNRNLASGGKAAARAQAEQVAGRIRNTVPRRTGRLAASVQVVPEDEGAGVSYGEGVPYADYIEHRTSSVESALDGADSLMEQAAQQAATQAVARA